MRKNQRNFYRILHVQPDAPEEIINTSYRTLMQRLKHHPDLGGDEWNAALINQAYSTISDSNKRDQYDRAINNVSAMRGSANQSGVAGGNRRQQYGHKVDLKLCLFCHEPHHYGVNIPIDSACKKCSSPLRAVEKTLLNESAGRKAERVVSTQRLHFYTQWPLSTQFAGIIQNVSLSGARFATNQRLEKKSYLKINCDSFNGVGQVVNCEKNKTPISIWSVSVIFETLSFSAHCGSFISLKA